MGSLTPYLRTAHLDLFMSKAPPMKLRVLRSEPAVVSALLKL